MGSRPHVVIKKTEQGVRAVQPLPAPAVELSDLNWDDLRFFLQVGTLGSLRAAAQAQGVSVNTVRSHIERLEAQCGTPLLRRTGKGSSVTDAGEKVLRIAREMRGATARSGIEADGNVLVSPGEVRISCSEGLGLLWLTPRVAALSEELGDLSVDFRLAYDLSKDRSDEADVNLTFVRPVRGDMIISRIATLHFMVFASEGYVRRHGAPRTMDEVMEHRIVEQVTAGVNSSLIDIFLGTERPRGLIPIRTNSSLAQLWAVANGAGIAPMPTYVRAITRSVVPIDPPLNLRFDLFCTYHGNARGSPAIEAAVAWLRRCFDPQAYPWFRSEFVHPDDFAMGRGGEVVSLFDNLIDPAGRR